MNITPEQAASLAEGYIEPWEMPDCPDAVELWESAYDLAQTIAGMTWEYAVEHEHTPGKWHRVTEWGPEENPYQPGYGPGDDERIVRRLVGPVEVIEGE